MGYVYNIEKYQQGSDKQWFQIFAILTACLSGLSSGLMFAWTSPSIPKIVNDKINYNITSEEASYFTVLPPIGSIVSCLIFAKTIDIFGRKYSVLFIVIPQIISLILTAIAKDVYILYMARFITGFGDACLFTSLPTYIGEISTPKVRTVWGNAMTFFLTCGQFLINVIGSYTDIETAAYICLTIPIVFICIFIFMPETPYYYLMKNRDDEAEKTLQTLLRKNNVDVELKNLKADVNRQMSESGTWKDLFLINSNRKALFIGIFLRASQQFGGFACFASYTQHIFLKSGSNLSATTSSILFMGLCTLLNPIAGYVLTKISRKKAYFYSSLSCGVILLIETIYFYIDQYHPKIDINCVNWIPVTGMIIFVVGFTFGAGIIPTLLLGELFSASIKGKGLCVLSIVFSALISLITKIFHLLDSNFGLYAPFLLFTISDFVSAALTLHFVPETKGKTLEEIQQELKGKKSKHSES